MDDNAEKSDSSVTPSIVVDDNEYNKKSIVAERKEGGEGEDVARQQSRAESIWPADNLTLPREVAMIFVVCMAQFCTREFRNLLCLYSPSSCDVGKTRLLFQLTRRN